MRDLWEGVRRCLAHSVERLGRAGRYLERGAEVPISSHRMAHNGVAEVLFQVPQVSTKARASRMGVRLDYGRSALASRAIARTASMTFSASACETSDGRATQVRKNAPPTEALRTSLSPSISDRHM